MYQTKNLGLNITEIEKDTLMAFNFDTDLGDNFKAIDEKTLSHRNITNCLLEVPQNIKLEIVDGVITLKEGSKVYVPNGPGVFEEKIIYTDISNKTLGNEDIFLAVSKEGGLIALDAQSFTVTERPETIQGVPLYYNITTNKIEYYDNSVWHTGASFPIAIVERTDNGFTGIKQIFNGFGYIGSTLFELPGVKGLVVEGINDDGTLITVLKTTSKVAIDTEIGVHSNSVISNLEGTLEATVWLGESDTHPSTEGVVASPRYLNTRTNFIQLDAGITGDWKNQYGYLQVFEDLKVDPTGKILSITPKKPFRAVDHNNYIQKITELETKIATLQAAVEALQG